jgi:hypothetical protein
VQQKRSSAADGSSSSSSSSRRAARTRTSRARGAHPGAWLQACRGAAPRCKSRSHTCVG